MPDISPAMLLKLKGKAPASPDVASKPKKSPFGGNGPGMDQSAPGETPDGGLPASAPGEAAGSASNDELPPNASGSSGDMHDLSGVPMETLQAEMTKRMTKSGGGADTETDPSHYFSDSPEPV